MILNKKCLVDLILEKLIFASTNQSNNSGAIDVKMDGSILMMLVLSTTASIKIGGKAHSMKFLSFEVALYLYKSTIQLPCMDYCCHVWAGAPRSYLNMFDKLEN